VSAREERAYRFVAGVVVLAGIISAVVMAF
jgi:hypothetical protein